MRVFSDVTENRESSPLGVLCRAWEAEKIHSQKGVALLMVLICSLVLVLIGLSLTMTEFSMGDELEAREKALLASDTGFRLAKNALRGQDLDTVLATNTTVNKYLNYPQPAGGTPAAEYFDRNPLSPTEAVNIDFSGSPVAISTRSVNDLLTPGVGSAVGTGRFFAKLSDNDDGDSNPLVDADGVKVLRIVGVHRGGAVENKSYGTSTQNAVSIIEANIRRVTTFDFDSPFTVYGPDVNTTFNGNSFDVDGNPHDINGNPIAGPAAPAFSIINNNPGSDATTAVTSTLGALSNPQEDNITGDGPDPSVQDTTDDVRNDPDPDAENIFDPNFVMDFAQRLDAIADINLSPGSYSGGGITWGTVGSPAITYCPGDLNLNGNGSGVGMLVVIGDLDVGGAFDYTGMVFVLGGDIEFSGANKTWVGGAFTADIIDNGDGTYSYGIPSVHFNGNSNFVYSAAAMSLANDLLAVELLSRREVTREIEPY